MHRTEQKTRIFGRVFARQTEDFYLIHLFFQYIHLWELQGLRGVPLTGCPPT